MTTYLVTGSTVFIGKRRVDRLFDRQDADDPAHEDVDAFPAYSPDEAAEMVVKTLSERPKHGGSGNGGGSRPRWSRHRRGARCLERRLLA